MRKKRKPVTVDRVVGGVFWVSGMLVTLAGLVMACYAAAIRFSMSPTDYSAQLLFNTLGIEAIISLMFGGGMLAIGTMLNPLNKEGS